MHASIPRLRHRDSGAAGCRERVVRRRPAVSPLMLTLLCLAAGGTARGEEPPAAAAADVVVTVGRDVILRRELDRVVARAVAGLQGDLVTEDKRQELEATAVEQLVDKSLLQQEIEKARITVVPEEVEAALRRLRGQLKERGLTWEQFLLRSGLDEEEVRAQSTLEVGLNKLLEPRLTDDRLQAVFQKQRRELDGSRLRVSHIVLRPDLGRGDVAVAETMAKASRIRSLVLRSDLSFAEASRRYSMGPSRSAGGDLGWITRQAPLHEEFSRQAFRLAKGEVSPPVVTPWGVHLIQVTAIEPGQATSESLRPELLRLAAADVIRETVFAARGSTAIVYAPGLHYFDPATPPGGSEPRRVLVADDGSP